MEINLPVEEVSRIKKDLEKVKKAHFKYEDEDYGNRDYYVRIDEISFEKGLSLIDQLSKVMELNHTIDKEIFDSVGTPYNLITVATNKLEEIKETGKMVSVFFCSNSRLDAPFPDKLIKPEECNVRVEVNPNK